ncbi:MAG: hypothetical protein AAF666_00330 [Pseudomonadota bacterium]
MTDVTDRKTARMASGAELNTGPIGQTVTFRCLAVIVVLGIMSWQLLLILAETDGTLFYSLDDPYIHLSLAENILSGHYGINSGEAASPSSSILYPFLIAGGLALGLGELAPMVLNGLAMMGIAWIFGGLVARLRPGLEPMIILALPLILLAINAAGLPFTGMEHTLHIWSSLLIVVGLIRLFETGRASAWLMMGIILSPLLRFEGFALSTLAILALLASKQPRAALISLAILSAITAAYVIFMTRLGLPPLPSSVLVKSPTSAAAVDAAVISMIVSVILSPLEAMANRFGLTLITGCSFLLLAMGRKAPRRGERTIALTVLGATFAHLFLGELSVYPRYEGYLLAIIYATLLWLYAPVLRAGNRIIGTGVAMLFAALSFLYIVPLRVTPEAAQNMRDQQWQMHVFATEFFPERVAVNDLGWTSYQNDQYVLDLWGLGSEEARRMAHEGRNQRSMMELATRNDVAYAMIYEDWFKGVIPSQWCRIAQLKTIHVTASRGAVEFYLIDPSREAEMRGAIQDFEAQLLPETSMDIFDCAAG